MKLLKQIFRFLCSLKLAVVVLSILTLALAVGTVLESKFDINTGRYWVYRSLWFNIVLLFLGINIFCVAVSRWPWKKRHIPFLTAHLGILLLLWGSLQTQLWGLDGQMPVTEGRQSSQVMLENSILFFIDDHGKTYGHEFEWIPPHVKYKPQTIQDWGVRVVDFITHAEPVFLFQKEERDFNPATAQPAIRFMIKGGPVTQGQQVWLWTGAKDWRNASLGPAQFAISPPSQDGKGSMAPGHSQSLFHIQAKGEGGFEYEVYSRDGSVRRGKVKEEAIGKEPIDLGWMGLQVHVEKWIPDAADVTYYRKSRVQYGNEAPQSAILVESLADPSRKKWIAQGNRTSMKIGEKFISLIYQTKHVTLPFALGLNQFQIEYQPGTREPASYSSRVYVDDAGERGKEHLIAMNEPLEYKGFLFYQSSYIPREPRPITSVFSVNQDPGRWNKYIGSILIVLGSILLFAIKYWNKRARVKS